MPVKSKILYFFFRKRHVMCLTYLNYIGIRSEIYIFKSCNKHSKIACVIEIHFFRQLCSKNTVVYFITNILC